MTQKAQELAGSAGISQIEPEHLLVSLVDQKNGVVPSVLRKLNVEPALIFDATRKELECLPRTSGGAQPALFPRLNEVGKVAKPRPSI